MNVPEIRYAKTPEGVHIAYQVVGEGPTDLIVIGAGYSNIEFFWSIPPIARYLRDLASIARIILFDPRGMGLSDPLGVEQLPTIETRMADTLSVMQAVGSERAALLGSDATGPLAILFAATYPERTTALILYGTLACGLKSPDYPWAWSPEEWDDNDREMEERWGDPTYVEEFWKWMSPTVQLDEHLKQVYATYFRVAASPGTAVALNRMERETDVRSVLPTVQVPTIVLNRTGDQIYSVGEGRYLAEQIPGARFVELDGSDHPPWDGDTDSVLAEIRRFLASVRNEEAEFDRVLASVLFTDVVGSTKKAAQLGDRGWRDLVERHHGVVRAMLARYRGSEVDTAGDGFFATFDGPARAVRCAQAIVEAVRPLGIDVRAGVHTGEVETIDTKVGGIAVVIASRIASMAKTSEVLASSTVKDLTAGSGLVFDDAGEHELKGIPDRWRLYRVVDP